MLINFKCKQCPNSCKYVKKNWRGGSRKMIVDIIKRIYHNIKGELSNMSEGRIVLTISFLLVLGIVVCGIQIFSGYLFDIGYLLIGQLLKILTSICIVGVIIFVLMILIVLRIMANGGD